MSVSSRWVLSGTWIICCWLMMQAVHELGHVIGAWSTGGTVVDVVLHPFTISRTDVQPNPKPLIEVWMGPIIGCVFPLLLWGISSLWIPKAAFLFRFLSGFCLIANGLSIGVGSFDAVGDCGELLRNGASPWHLWVFGLLTTPFGFYLWNGLGPYFGWGKSPRQVDRNLSLASCGVMFAILLAELLLSRM